MRRTAKVCSECFYFGVKLIMGIEEDDSAADEDDEDCEEEDEDSAGL